MYYTPEPAYVPTTPHQQHGSIEAQLKQLDALAAGGYITPAEYQTRRNADPQRRMRLPLSAAP